MTGKRKQSIITVSNLINGKGGQESLTRISMIEQSLVVLKKRTLSDIIIDTFLFLIIMIAIIVTIFCTLIITKENLHPDKVPDVMGYKPFIVLTGSMEPTIKAGDLVIVKQANLEELNKGDIIAFRNTEDDVVLIHRIAEKETKDGKITLKTKGDNNQSEDRVEVGRENIEGIYVVEFEKLGAVAMFIRKPEGLTISILTIITTFFLWQLIKCLRREKRINKRLKECEEALEEAKKEKEGIKK